jgi:hypothetical protein
MPQIKTGTRIEMHGTPAFPGFPGVAPERATIARWTKVSGPIKSGWHIVRFADGGSLCVHETRFRVIDNR